MSPPDLRNVSAGSGITCGQLGGTLKSGRKGVDSEWAQPEFAFSKVVLLSEMWEVEDSAKSRNITHKSTRTLVFRL